jgi:hypothetical protein
MKIAMAMDAPYNFLRCSLIIFVTSLRRLEEDAATSQFVPFTSSVVSSRSSLPEVIINQLASLAHAPAVLDFMPIEHGRAARAVGAQRVNGVQLVDLVLLNYLYRSSVAHISHARSLHHFRADYLEYR